MQRAREKNKNSWAYARGTLTSVLHLAPMRQMLRIYVITSASLRACVHLQAYARGIHARDNKKGFTIIEAVIVVVILGVLGAVAITDFALQKKRTDISGSMQEVIGVVRLAQSKTLASENSSQYGVYFNTVPSPQTYILFKGSSYAGRDASFDIVYVLPGTIELFPISLGSGSELVFDKLTGASEQSGSVSLRLTSDTSQTQTFYIANSGAVSFSAVPVPSDDARVKDSRHVQFNYTKNINGTNITLNFSYNNGPTTSVSIIVDSFTNSGVFDWSENDISVSGTSMLQCIKLHTNSVTNPMKFDVYRDGRCNNTALNMVSSSDSNKIIDYSSNGLTVTHTSIYSDASNSSWQ